LEKQFYILICNFDICILIFEFSIGPRAFALIVRVGANIMGKEHQEGDLEYLPACASEFISLVIKKMRYRRKVRRDVQAELIAHFEDALKGCTTDQEKEQKAQQLIAEFGDAKLLAVLCRRAKKRCRPLWRKILVRSAQALGTVFLYLLVCISPLAIGKPNISVDYVDWLNKLVRQGKDEAGNARPYYEKATALYVKMPDCLSRSMEKWPADLNDMELNSLSTWLAENEPAIEMLRQGANQPYYWNIYESNEPDLTTGIMNRVMAVLPAYRHLAFDMRWRIRFQAHNGDVETALQDCIVLQKFGGHMHGKGLLIEQLVGVAIEALAHNVIFTILQKVDVPAEALQSVQQELERQFGKKEPVISLEAEKAFWYDQIQRTFTDDGRGGGRVLLRGLPYVVKDWMGGLWGLVSFSYPDRREVMARTDKYFGRTAELFDKTPWDLNAEGIDSDAWHENLQASLMLDIVGPAHSRVGQIGWRTKTSRLAVLSVLAIMRCRKEKGAYPASLDELVAAGYLKRLPMDPYSDGTLVYRETDDGFLLYSLGADLKDDGGKLGLSGDGKPRMWADNGDWVFWPVHKPQRNR
jgi:hypothetical protein